MNNKHRIGSLDLEELVSDAFQRDRSTDLPAIRQASD
jgi:hypothetical protein